MDTRTAESTRSDTDLTDRTLIRSPRRGEQGADECHADGGGEAQRGTRRSGALTASETDAQPRGRLQMLHYVPPDFPLPDAAPSRARPFGRRHRRRVQDQPIQRAMRSMAQARGCRTAKKDKR